MYRSIILATLISLVSISTNIQAAETKELAGAGATFPYPVYSKWAEGYEKETGIKLKYLPVGSGAGVQQVVNGTVDFGASDKPLTSEELQKDGLLQFPAIMGGIVIAYNVKGIETDELKLTAPILADIYMGKITKWNDARIKEINPKLDLPDENIKVVYRDDESGTTFIFTSYLSDISSDWKEKIGAKTSVSWPVGDGAEGNEGVSALINTIPGAIGYVEYSYAKDKKLKTAQLQNRDGAFVKPSLEAFKAASDHADWAKAKDSSLTLTNQPGKKSWPIIGASYVLVHKKGENPDATGAVIAFYDWSFKNGDATAKSISFVSLPKALKQAIRKSWEQDLKIGATAKE